MSEPLDFHFDFSSPCIIVDGEPFFGADHLPQIEYWQESGGF